MRIFIGYILILAIYFLVKTILFMPLKVTNGVVQSMGGIKYEMGESNGKAVMGTAEYPIIAFRVPAEGSDSGKLYLTSDKKTMSFHEYHEGEHVQVSYNPKHIEQARAYSFGEYWLPAPNMVVLILACIVYTAVYVVVVYKKYKMQTSAFSY